MTDPKLTLAHRFELEKEVRHVQREEEAQLVRLAARRELAADVAKAQAAVMAAEELAFKNLPTPLPENAGELVAQHPVALGRHQQLRRIEDVYGPARIELAEAVAKAMTDDNTDSLPAASPKPPRRGKPNATEGGTP